MDPDPHEQHYLNKSFFSSKESISKISALQSCDTWAVFRICVGLNTDPVSDPASKVNKVPYPALEVNTDPDPHEQHLNRTFFSNLYPKFQFYRAEALGQCFGFV